MRRPIAISLSPNTQKQDIVATIRLLFSPWHYLQGGSIKLLEQWFRTTFAVSYAITFHSGRSALFVILKALDIQKGDEVILQPFTCVAVANAVIWSGATPVYVDITASFSFDETMLEKQISKKTKAIIVQYTFGIPQDIERIKTIAKKHRVALIEDCAHIIGGEIGKQKLGTFGTAAIFSFGRDKAFSSVFGGMAITDDETLGKKIRAIQKGSSMPSVTWLWQQLLHPLAFSLLLPFYTLLLGKALLVVLQKVHVLSFPYTPEEKKSNISGLLIQKMPNALCELAYLQLKRLKQFNATREEFTSYYTKHLKALPAVTLPWTAPYPLLRYPLLIENPEEVVKQMRKKGIYLGRWYSCIIDPKGTDLQKIGYTKGSCPQAEYMASHVLNLPTYPTLKKKDASKVLQLLNMYVQR